MSARNFGLTGERSALGADVRSGPIIASGGPRESSIQLAGGPTPCSSRTPLANSRGASSELSIREYAAAFFVGAFLAGIAVCLWFLCLIIDWSGVVEALRQG